MTSNDTYSFQKLGLAITFLVILLLINVLPIWSFFQVVPNFVSAIIYLWTVYRPDLTPRRVYIILGLIRDGLFNYPIGVSIFELMLIVSVTKLLRRFVVGRSFWLVFMGYVIFTLSSNLLIWALLSLTKGIWLPLGGAMKSILLNLLIYPLMCQISIGMQTKIDSIKRRAFD